MSSDTGDSRASTRAGTRCGLAVPDGLVARADSFPAAMEAAGCRAEFSDGISTAPTLDDADLDRFAERARMLVRASEVPSEPADATAAREAGR